LFGVGGFVRGGWLVGMDVAGVVAGGLGGGPGVWEWGWPGKKKNSEERVGEKKTARWYCCWRARVREWGRPVSAGSAIMPRVCHAPTLPLLRYCMLWRVQWEDVHTLVSVRPSVRACYRDQSFRITASAWSCRTYVHYTCCSEPNLFRRIRCLLIMQWCIYIF
jgi:hypothetical protein